MVGPWNRLAASLTYRAVCHGPICWCGRQVSLNQFVQGMGGALRNLQMRFPKPDSTPSIFALQRSQYELLSAVELVPERRISQAFELILLLWIRYPQPVQSKDFDTMTVVEFCERLDISVTDLFFLVLDYRTGGTSFADREVEERTNDNLAPSSKGKRKSSSRSRKAPKKNAKPKEVNTRSRASRQAFDERVENCVKSASKPLGAREVRDRCGGTAMQVRVALNRLIERGKITFEGQARGTKYLTA